MTVEILLGPNPLSEQLNYKIHNLERTCRLTIYDNLGQEMQSTLIEPDGVEGKLDIRLCGEDCLALTSRLSLTSETKRST